MTIDIDIDELERVAKAATGSDWDWDAKDEYIVRDVGGQLDTVFMAAPWLREQPDRCQRE